MLELRIPASMIAGLMMLGLAAVPAGAQQAKNVAIVNAVLDHRAHWVGDSTRVDACSVYEALGRPANFPAGINPNLIPLLDRTRDPCAADSARVTVRWPPRFVRMDTLQANGSAGPYVALTIVKGEYRYREHYTLRTWQSGGTIGAGVREVRTYGLLQAHLVPPRRRMPNVSPK
jgi:hypothetical protein